MSFSRYSWLMSLPLPITLPEESLIQQQLWPNCTIRPLLRHSTNAEEIAGQFRFIEHAFHHSCHLLAMVYLNSDFDLLRSRRLLLFSHLQIWLSQTHQTPYRHSKASSQKSCVVKTQSPISSFDWVPLSLVLLSRQRVPTLYLLPQLQSLHCENFSSVGEV